MEDKRKQIFNWFLNLFFSSLLCFVCNILWIQELHSASLNMNIKYKFWIGILCVKQER